MWFVPDDPLFESLLYIRARHCDMVQYGLDTTPSDDEAYVVVSHALHTLDKVAIALEQLLVPLNDVSLVLLGIRYLCALQICTLVPILYNHTVRCVSKFS